MKNNQIEWIWQITDWPKFHWQDQVIQPLLREVRLKQGILIGKTGAVTQEIPLESALDTLLQKYHCIFSYRRRVVECAICSFFTCKTHWFAFKTALSDV